MIYWIAYFFMKVLTWIFCPCKFIGRENIPSKGAFLVASNHVSNIDPFIIGSGFCRRLGYLAKEELFRNKVHNFFFRSVGAFPIKRGVSDLGAIKEILRRLKAGEPVLLFPEGTRTLYPAKRKIQAGVGLIAAKSNLPVVPVYIDGSQKVLPPGAKWLQRHPITITFGRPLRFTKDQREPPLAIAHKIMNEILSLSNSK